MKLFFDTETTGLPDWRLPDTHELQPRMVQLGMVVCEDNGDVVFSLGTIIRPDGFTISDEVAKIHGISNDTAMRSGISVELALDMFNLWADRCDELIAHNIKFDRLVLSAELWRKFVKFPQKTQFCTMLSSTGICKIPKKQGYKWPKLSEAYQHFFGEELKDAHDALVDVMACKRIYFEGLKTSVMAEPSLVPTIHPTQTITHSTLQNSIA